MEHPHPPSLSGLARKARRLLFLFGLLALLALFGGSPARADEAPRFLIEKITVQGNRRPAAARIVVSESLLQEGRTYGEDDLRTAIRRIKRLPFIIEADFALQKGSERGRYLLLITVEETRPIFVDIEEVGDSSDRSGIDSPIRGARRFDFSNNSLLGVREFVGSEGVVFATFGSSNGLFQLGYTRYDLFGPGSFASLAVGFSPHDNKETTTSLSAGVPLTVNQSLRATVAASQARFRGNGFRDDSSQQSGQLDWLYNTTDDPLFPTRGATAEALLDYRKTRFDFKDSALGASSRNDERTWGLTLSANRHRPLTARQSLAFGLAASAYRFHAETRPSSVFDGTGTGYQASATVTHAFDLWPGDRARHWGDLRLETSASYVGAYNHGVLSSLSEQTRVYQLSIGETLVFRNPWAIVRLGLAYHGKVMR